MCMYIYIDTYTHNIAQISRSHPLFQIKKHTRHVRHYICPRCYSHVPVPVAGDWEDETEEDVTRKWSTEEEAVRDLNS